MRTSKVRSGLIAGMLAVAMGAVMPRLRAADARETANHTVAADTDSANKTELNQIVKKIASREQNEITSFELFRPIIEIYVQQLRRDRDMGAMPDVDAYFVGQADLSKGIEVRSMLPKHGFLYGLTADLSKAALWQWGGFVQMIYPDRYYFDLQHYTFNYAGQDFLGEVRCLMFDVTPKPHSDKAHFKGRIWVEDHDYTIVRFNGSFSGAHTSGIGHSTTHFDSWRMNVQPDLWLPAYVYIEGVNKKAGDVPTFKAQTRFWAYSPKVAANQSEFSDLYIDSDQPVQDDSSHDHDLSPVQEERQFDRDAENNVLYTLGHDGLIAPEGPVDKVLDTVLNNLEVTNNLNVQPEFRCRVMLTSNMELFSVGHTIVISRGLLDVLPDESTLAVMLAQELSDALVWKPNTSEYGFYDVIQTPSSKALKTFSFKESKSDLESESAQTLAILKNSPYRSNLGAAALFFQELNGESKRVPHLIGPHLGNRIYPIAALMNAGPLLQRNKVDQTAALPMGSRVKLNPWNDELELLKTQQVALLSAREKMPFEITPFIPYLTRYNNEVHLADVGTHGDGVSKNNDPQAPNN